MKAHVFELLGFDKLFENEEFDQISALQELPLFASVELIAWTTAQVSLNSSDLNKQSFLLKHWIEQFPTKEYIKHRKLPTSGVIFIALPVSLRVIELLLTRADKTSQSKSLTSEQVFSLFKIYLCESLEYTNELNSFKAQLTIEDLTNLDRFIDLALPANIPYFDLTMSSSPQVELYKATEFFKYCLANEEATFLADYLSSLGYDNWEDYLRRVLSLYFHLYNELRNDTIKAGIELDPNDNSDSNRTMKELLELLKLDLNSFETNIDFMGIRSKPVLQIEGNLYVILSNQILLNKLFQVIQFNFGEFIANNGGRIYDLTINNSLAYKSSVYSSRFAEGFILYNLLEYITDGKRKYVSRNGAEVKAITGDNKTEPDYYIREGNNIFIFECKDVLFSIAAKTSYDILEVKKEIFKKLAKSQNNKPKGIGQLTKVIEYIASGDYGDVDNKIPSSVNIYPILIITDVSFAALGINHILDSKLSELVAEIDFSGKPNKVRVKPLTLMRVDTLITYRDLFRNESIPFRKAIVAYTSKIRDPSAMLNPIQSFGDFMEKRYGKVMSGFWGRMEADIKRIVPIN